MPRTRGRFSQDLGFPDGILVLPPNKAIQTGGASVLTRNAAGDISHNAGAAVSPIYSFCLADCGIFRTGYAPDKDDMQEQWGGSGNVGSSVQGRPPFTGMTGITPSTAKFLKGMKIKGFKVIYSITGAALTGHTCRLDKTVFANNVAAAITNILASGANGLSTATQANPYVTTIMLAAAEQIYRISDLSQYIFELAPTTQAGGAFRLYGVEVLVEYNFN